MLFTAGHFLFLFLEALLIAIFLLAFLHLDFIQWKLGFFKGLFQSVAPNKAPAKIAVDKCLLVIILSVRADQLPCVQQSFASLQT